MVTPYVAIAIEADSNVSVAYVRDETSNVEVEKILLSELERLKDELASATNGRNIRIYIIADKHSEFRSYIASVDALHALGLHDYWIVAKPGEY